MWILINREPRPDALDWPGRRWLTAIDAVGWPAAWVAFVPSAPVPTGVIGQVAVAVAVWCGLGRLHRALCATTAMGSRPGVGVGSHCRCW